MTGPLRPVGPVHDGTALVCFPFAGGSADFYARWRPYLPRTVDIWGVTLAGRGRRWSERYAPGLTAAADETAAAVQGLGIDRPVVLLGHSMGAVLAWETSRRLAAAGHLPRLLVVSGCAAPGLLVPGADLADLSDGKLVERLRQWGGTPEEVLTSRELLAYFLPQLREDLLLLDGYRAPATAAPAPIPVLALAGRDDLDAPPAAVADWSTTTTSWRGSHVLPGGHFFVDEEAASCCQLLRGALDGEAVASVGGVI